MVARRAVSGLAWCVVALVLAPASSAADDQAPGESAAAEAVNHFETQVRPLLAAKCWKCHGADKQQASLRLDSSAAVTSGGDSGPAVVPGDPEHSPMIAAVRWSDEPKMPPDARLSETEIAALVTWVKRGAMAPNNRDH